MMTQEFTPPPVMDGTNRPFSSTNPFRLSALAETTQPVSNRGDNQGFHHWMDNQLSSPNPVPAQNRTDRQNNYIGNTPSSSAPVAMSSNNPFLDETEMTESTISSDYSRGSYRNVSPMRPGTGRSAATTTSATSAATAAAPHQYGSTSSHSLPIQRSNVNTEGNGRSVVAPRYPTSREEKERLRQKYLNTGNNNSSRSNSNGNGNNEEQDLPPSYEEVAGTRDNRNRYPREKDPSRAYDLDQRRRHHNHHSSSSRRRNDLGIAVPQRYRRDSGSTSAVTVTTAAAAAANMRRKKKLNGKPTAPKNVDTIDRLDVTGLFGGSFHHDGPFDACTPHRNKDTKAAPVLAFPADGPNNSISGATAKKSVMNEMFGVEDIDDDDDYDDTGGSRGRGRGRRYSSSLKDSIRSNVGEIKQMDAKTRTEKVHGPVTAGLGSSTFLDGAPAPSYMIKASNGSGSTKLGGLHRGKSLNYTGGRVSSSKSGEVQRNSNFDGRRRKSESNYDGRGYGRASQRGGGSGFNNGVDGYGYDYGDNDDDDEDAARSYDYSDDGEDGSSEEEDAYVSGVGMRFEGSMRREALTAESSGNKFLKRVKSLKVGSSKKK